MAATAVLVGHWLSRIDAAGLTPLGFDPRQLPAAPRALGLDDPWRTLSAPLGLATALALALRAIPATSRKPEPSSLLMVALLNPLYGGGVDLPAPRLPRGLPRPARSAGGLGRAKPLPRRC